MIHKHTYKYYFTAFLVVFLFCLTACSKQLNGTYTSDGVIKQSFTFKPDNVVVMSAFGINAEGTYKIQNDKIIITYKFANLNYISYDWTRDFEEKGNSIFIDGTEFKKVFNN